MLRYLRWQLLLTLLGLALVGGLLVNLTYSRTTTVVPAEGGIYIEGLAGRVRLINPLLWQTDAEHDLVSLIFSGLTRTDERGNVVADLAESWTVMDGGLTYVFVLRSDARWHDGTPVTADDVVFTIRLLQDPAFDARPALAEFWRTVTVDRLDGRTVRFSLSEPLAAFLEYASFPLLPAHLLQGVSLRDLSQHPFNRRPVGSGPFRLVELETDRALLVAHEDYHGPQPYLGQIEFRFYPDAQSLLTAYRDGEIQGISHVLPRDLETAARLPGLALYTMQQARCVAIFLNLDQPLFQDRLVRRALLLGLDRQALIDEVLQGQGIIADSPIQPGSWAYNPYVQRVPYDPDRARALLDRAGWIDQDGDGVRERDGQPLAFELLTNADSVRQALAQAVVDQWAELGVRASLRVLNITELQTDFLRPRAFEAVLFGWDPAMADPDPYPLWHSSQIERGQNIAGFRHPEVDGILEDARRSLNGEERRDLYWRFQEVFAAEVPALLLYRPVYHYAVTTEVWNVQVPRTILAPSDRFVTLHRWYLRTQRVIEIPVESPLLTQLRNYLRDLRLHMP